MLELAVLGLLKEQPLHGYELKKRLGETLGVFWGVSFGSLYPALRRLERSGAIEAVAPETATSPIPATGSIGGETAAARIRQRLSGTGRRTKRSYRITPRGDDLFVELFATDETGDDERSFALRLAFCRHLEAEARLAFLEHRRQELVERLTRARPSLARGDRYTRSLVEHRTRSIERDLEWVDELIAAERAEPAADKEGATA